MAKQTVLERKAKEAIIRRMEELNEITTEEVMNLIEPHFIFDALKAKKQAIRRKAHSLMSQFKDDRGVRTCFSYNNDGNSIYVNIDKTNDMDALIGVEDQISQKYYGLNKAKKKIDRRKQELSGQISMDEII